MPKLFVSSASGDDDLYVEGFFQDLCRRIDALAGDRGTARSMLAVTPGGLPGWSAGMVEAIATCDAFIALCSPRYFLNEACGRQWWLFEARLRRHERQTGVRPPALIPLPWTLDAQVPAGLAASARMEPGRGLRQLVRLRGMRDAYATTVADIAGRVVAADEPPLPLPVEPPPDFAATPSAFAAPASAPPVAGVPRIRFVVAAGTREEMRAVREDLACYGTTREQWAPYRPALGTPIAERARVVAAAHLLQSEVGSIDDMIDRIENARRDTEPVVVLVDAWAIQVDACKRVLAELDRRGLAGAAVLVPMNFADAETARYRRDLRFGLQRVFRNSAHNPTARLRSEIESPDRFDVDLAAVLEDARNKSFRDGRVHRLLPGDQPGERPILRGP